MEEHGVVIIGWAFSFLLYYQFYKINLAVLFLQIVVANIALVVCRVSYVVDFILVCQ